MKNRSDLITAVLQNLGIFAPGQVPRTSPEGNTKTRTDLISLILQNLGIFAPNQTQRTTSEGNTRTRADLIGLILQNLGVLRPGQTARTPASSTKTHADLVKAVLENMQTFGAGQDPPAEDVDTTQFRIDQALEELKTRGVYTGPVAGPYPDDLFVPLASTLCAMLATPWGIAKLDGLDVETYRANAEKRLLQSQLSRGDGNVLVEARLDGLLEELNNRGIYTGGITTTFPDTVYVPLAAAAAAMLASPLGIEKLDGMGLLDYRNDAERRLYKADLLRGRAYNQVNNRLNGVLEELNTRGIYTGGITTTFPDTVYVPLAAAAAAMLASSLGIEKLDGVGLFDYRNDAEQRLYKADLVRGRAFNQLSNRLEGILSELEAREVYMGVSFDEFDDAVFPSLVEAVSAIAAPSLGQQQIQGMNVDAYRQVAEIRLRRVNSAGNLNLVVQADYF